MKKIIFSLGARMVFLCAILGSCSTGDPASVMMAGRSSRSLVFLGCKAVSQDVVEFTFSEPVKVSSIQFEPSQAVSQIEGDGSVIRVKLEESLAPGVLLKADLLAEDGKKNSINVIVPFRARNNRMPKMMINELRTEQSGNKVEFIEFKMLTAGNLGAIRVFIASNQKTPMVFQFLPVEVGNGEYVVLHMRTKEDGCKDEYGANLDESKGTDAENTARDFWIPGNTEFLRKTDIIYVLDQDDNVLDAVAFSEKPDEWWTKEHLAQAAEFLHEKGAWTSADGSVCGPAQALNSAHIGSSLTRSISRNTAEDSNTAANWYVTANSGASPGKQNNPSVFVPKN